LAPEWTDYFERLQYQTFDVTSLLNQGENVIGAMLGDGWYLGRLGLVDIDPSFPRRGVYGPNRRLLVQLMIEKADGTREIVKTDGRWKIHLDGPIQNVDIFLGETYDVRKEIPNWDSPGFDDSQWMPATVDRSIQKKLVSQMNEPIRVIKELKPIALSESKPGVYVFDLGQNIVGWSRVQLNGPKDTVVTLRHGEMLNPDGTLYTANLRSADQIDRFILDGRGERELEPHFTYHGFRYVEVTGLVRKPTLDMLTGCVIASDTTRVGSFECSNPTLNKLWQNILWTQRGNMHSIPTDCPQRSERMGWMGDAQIFSQTAIFNMDMAAFFRKWLRDIRDSQAPDGRFGDFAPHPRLPKDRFYNAPGWADAGIIIPWKVYVNYGDKQILEEHYEASKRFVDHIYSANPDLVWVNSIGNNYGDWLNGNTIKSDDYPKTGAAIPSDVFCTAFFANSTQILSKMVAVLERDSDAERYRDLAQRIRKVFNERFVNEQGQIKGDTQAGYAVALNFDLLPESLRSQAARNMVKAIYRYEDRASTGIQSTFRMMLELSRWRYNDLAYQLIESRRFPSWGYTIDQGATTIWERWDGYVAGRGFQDPGMNSFNHYAFGAVGEWMYKTVLGINPDQNKPGYKHVIIHPQPGGSLTWAKGWYDSIRGRIVSDWKLKDGKLILSVTIPANMTATVYVPTNDPANITESGKPAKKANGVQFLRMEDGNAVFAVESGQYQFVVSRF